MTDHATQKSWSPTLSAGDRLRVIPQPSTLQVVFTSMGFGGHETDTFASYVALAARPAGSCSNLEKNVP